MFKFKRTDDTLTLLTVLGPPILPAPVWLPEEFTDVSPEPFRDPWADDPDRMTRRETFTR